MAKKITLRDVVDREIQLKEQQIESFVSVVGEGCDPSTMDELRDFFTDLPARSCWADYEKITFTEDSVIFYPGQDYWPELKRLRDLVLAG